MSRTGGHSPTDPAAHLHLYGKDDARAGRKMGHVTWLGPLDAPPPVPAWPPTPPQGRAP